MNLSYRLIAALLVAGPLTAFAQAWPSKPIRLIITYPPGGTSDILGRIIQRPLEERLGQTVIVDNRPGGGGTIGAAVVAQSAPDGYTLLLSNSSPISVSPFMMDKPPYDPVASFTHVAYVGSIPSVFLVPPSVPVKTVAELVALAKSRPDGLAYSGAAAGNVGHILGELLKEQTGINLVHIGYRGSAPMQVDLLGGRIVFAIDGLTQHVKNIHAGSVRALAVTAPQRSPEIPDVPTVIEAGFPKLVGLNFVGISGPARLPASIVERLNKAIVEIVALPAVKQQLATLSVISQPMSSKEFSSFVEGQVRDWSGTVRRSGVKLQ